MTLKNWFSKFMIEDTKRRLWAVALVTLLFFFSFPVATVFVAGTRYSQNRIEWLRSFSRIMLGFVSNQNIWVAFIIVVLAIVCGVSGFSYLDSKKKVDFYHSIPIKREKIFAVNYLNGILIVAVPYLINVMISAAIAVSQGVPPAILGEAFKGWAYFMTYYLMIYATVVIAVVMTGNLIVGLLGTGIFFFYGPMVLLLAEGYYSTWFYSYYDSGQFVEHVGKVSPFINYCMGGTPTWKFFLLHLAAGLILTLIALLLYRKRPSEAAGKAMAFTISKPVIRILIVVLSALGGALFFWGMRGNIGWAVFGLITGCLISHCVIEIIYNFDFKKLFSHYKQMICCFAVSLIVLCIFRYDLFGFDRYIPKESQVASAAVSISNLDEWVEYGELVPFDKPEEDYEERILNQWAGIELFSDRPFMWESESKDEHLFREMKITDIPAVLHIAQNGVDLVKARKKAEMGRSSLWSGRNPWQERGATYINISFQYNMKNGRTVHRYYSVNKAVVEENIRKIYRGQEYKEGTYPLLALQKEDVVEVQFEKFGKTLKIDRQKMGKLLEAYQEALRGMSQEQLTDLCPIGTIRFLTEDKKTMIDWEENYKKNGGTNYYYRSYGNRERYPVYECFTDVMSLLAEENSLMADNINTDAVEEIIINDRRSYYKDEIWISGEEAKIFKKEEIEELAPILISTEYLSYNSFNFNRDMTLDAEVVSADPEDERDYGRQQFIIKLNEIPEKYLDRISYNKTTEAIKTADDYED